MIRNFMKVAALAGTCLCLTVTVLADPRPGLESPKRGDYRSNWGNARFDYDTGPRSHLLSGKFFFDNGHVIWGNFLPPMPGDPPSNWALHGRFVIKPESRGGAPSSLSGARRCPSKMPSIPDSFDVPDSYYWGGIRVGFNSSGTHIISEIFPCRTSTGTHSEASTALSLTGNWLGPTTYAVAPRAPETVAAPSWPYDGPCHSISRTAVAELSPCTLPVLRTFKVKLLKDLPKAVNRVIFTPLSDDNAAIARAVENSTILPVHPTGREVFQEVRGGKLWKRGDTADVIPPGSVCYHDLWAISLRDGAGTIHRSNGILFMECGPGDTSHAIEAVRAKM